MKIKEVIYYNNSDDDLLDLCAGFITPNGKLIIAFHKNMVGVGLKYRGILFRVINDVNAFIRLRSGKEIMVLETEREVERKDYVNWINDKQQEFSFLCDG